MSNKMLIDATHPEETRVVVLRGNRVEEFDFEAADRQQLRGNIYLAKVTRVEPSLQAAFIEYGGNRHGFLAFSEIHPDYYQIPVADRKALLEEHAAEAAEEARRETRADDQAVARREAEDRRDEESLSEVSEIASDEPDDHDAESDDPASGGADDERNGDEAGGFTQAANGSGESDFAAPEASGDEDNGAATEASASGDDGSEAAEPPHNHDDAAEAGASGETKVESVGAEDAMEEVPERRKPRPRQYKIQEVIKRRQVLLVQVVKEERGSKGAALTTYLSLAGRYSVLMPNTARGGGISRKITNAVDRKRLKSVAGELEVPQGMGVILRTAGANRTKTEIKRDFEYLLRLWENVRELTLRSTAPKLVYEEGSLIKRSIRDLYSREIDQVMVAGEDAYREAKDFMRMLMPSHAKNVQPYRDDSPIFARNNVETQLDAMFSPQVTLRSGGYIVINQTEALVAIDVNSGRSTREHNIEDTALNTNLEAAEEVSRQLRLRDLAGLIVIDFIDMEENRNNRAVERKLKDCLRADRARIQIGRISHFGLMEMSRQRIRTGVLESSVVACPHCRGTGQVRSISSLSLQILRALEDYLLRHNGHHLVVRTRPEVALYVLNQKRQHLARLEDRFGLTITLLAEAPHDGAGYAIDRGEAVLEPRPPTPAATATFAPEDPADDFVEEEEDEIEAEAEEPVREDGERQERGGRGRRNAEAAGEEEGRGSRRRRRRRRGGNGEDRPERDHGPREPAAREYEAHPAEQAEEPRGVEADAETGETPTRGETATRGEDESAESRRRRRGRRGGRRRGRGRDEASGAEESRGTDFAGEPYAAADVGGESEGEEPRSSYDAADSSDASRNGDETPAGTPSWPEPEASGNGAVNWKGEPAEAAMTSGADPIEQLDEPSDAIPAVSRSEPAVSASEAEAAAPDTDSSANRNPAAEEPAAQPAPPPEPEYTGPKRSGWWNKRLFS